MVECQAMVTTDPHFVHDANDRTVLQLEPEGTGKVGRALGLQMVSSMRLAVASLQVSIYRDSGGVPSFYEAI